MVGAGGLRRLGEGGGEVGHLLWGPQLLLLKKASILFHAQTHVSQDLAQKGPNDNL